MSSRLPMMAALAGTLVFSTAPAFALTSDQLPAPVSGVPASYGPWGFDLHGMDRSIAPGDNFYAYANGAWQQRAKLPSDRVATGSFPDLRESANDHVHVILEQVAALHAAPNTQEGKLGALYLAFLDEAAVNAKGEKPLEAYLQRIRAVRSRIDMAAIMGAASSGFGASIFDLDISSDDNNPTRYALHIGQGKLGLPDRDYYLQPGFANKKTDYQKYVANMLSLIGWPDAGRQAKAIVTMETSIALASWPHSRIRDPLQVNHPQTIVQLEQAVPDFAWARFLKAAGFDSPTAIVTTTNTSLPLISAIFAATPLDTLKAWEAFHTADAAAPYMSQPFVDAAFDFHARDLAGQQTMAPRWRRAVDLVNDAMGSAVGELYVARYFPPKDESTMKALVAQIREALRNRIAVLPWMSPSTKAEALLKLSHLEVQVGRPVRWIDYDALSIPKDDLLGDVALEKAFDWKRRIEQMSAPWNKSDWRFWPQYPTAYSENGQLIFTAAMLQAPYFNPRADAAVNYGAIGAVIGHELTHYFDDQGRLFDANERLRDWWTPADAKGFEERAKQLEAQYSAMEVLPGVHVNGQVTVGENIADLGGLTIALDAYRTSLHGRPSPVLDGFTGDQRVFLGWAQGWRQKIAPDALRRQVATDPHSPAQVRVNGVMRNIDAWYTAFGVTKNQRLWLSPEQQIHVW